MRLPAITSDEAVCAVRAARDRQRATGGVITRVIADYERPMKVSILTFEPLDANRKTSTGRLSTT